MKIKCSFIVKKILSQLTHSFNFKTLYNLNIVKTTEKKKMATELAKWKSQNLYTKKYWAETGIHPSKSIVSLSLFLGTELDYITQAALQVGLAPWLSPSQ